VKARYLLMIIPLALVLALAACSGGGEVVSGKTKGDLSFEKGDYTGSIEHYRKYLEIELGAADVWLAQYMMARAYYESEDYPTAALEFEIFKRNYPRSDSLEAAAYYEALCWFQQSPSYDRDSTPTHQALRKLEDYLLDYPNGQYQDAARSKLAELNDKLARKTLSIARFYHRLSRLDAAVLYYEKLLREQPESSLVGEALEDFERLRRDQGRVTEAEELADLRARWMPPPGAP